jgi:hypothetical protein
VIASDWLRTIQRGQWIAPVSYMSHWEAVRIMSYR